MKERKKMCDVKRITIVFNNDTIYYYNYFISIENSIENIAFLFFVFL